MMCEWGISFDHIEEHWTDRQFFAMFRRLRERQHAEAAAIKAAYQKGR